MSGINNNLYRSCRRRRCFDFCKIPMLLAIDEVGWNVILLTWIDVSRLLFSLSFFSSCTYFCSINSVDLTPSVNRRGRAGSLAPLARLALLFLSKLCPSGPPFSRILHATKPLPAI